MCNYTIFPICLVFCCWPVGFHQFLPPLSNRKFSVANNHFTTYWLHLLLFKCLHLEFCLSLLHILRFQFKQLIGCVHLDRFRFRYYALTVTPFCITVGTTNTLSHWHFTHCHRIWRALFLFLFSVLFCFVIFYWHISSIQLKLSFQQTIQMHWFECLF